MNPLLSSSETLAFNNSAGRLYYHPSGHVRLAWNPGRLPIGEVQAYYEKVLTLLKSAGARKILSDHGQRSPLLPAAQQWLSQDWIPRAIAQAQTRHCAIVEGVDPVHRLSTETVVATAPPEFLFKRFGALVAAETWLASVQL